MSCKFGGRLFYTRGPTAVKLLSPYVLSVRGTTQVLSTADLRRWQPLSATSLISSVKYVRLDLTTTGAPRMQLCTPLVARQEASATGLAGARCGHIVRRRWLEWSVCTPTPTYDCFMMIGDAPFETRIDYFLLSEYVRFIAK